MEDTNKMPLVRKETTLEMRKLIIDHWKEGKSVRNISSILQRGSCTVHNVIKRYKQGGRIENKSRSGRPYNK